MIKIVINNLKNKKYRGTIKKSISETCKRLNIKTIMISITIIGDKKIKDLNKKYLKKDKPTDVLTFSIDDKDCLGDIYISGKTARKNAQTIGHTYEEELSFLTIHSILHLAGYNHKNAKERIQMEKKENIIFNSIWGN